jgi:hypothetical protein
MRKYSHGYVTIPADLRDDVNKALFEEGLGVNFFNIPIQDAGKNLLYGAIASLNEWQWAVVNKVLKAKCKKEDADVAVTTLDKKPTKANCEKAKADRVKIEKDKEKPVEPDKPDKK